MPISSIVELDSNSSPNSVINKHLISGASYSPTSAPVNSIISYHKPIGDISEDYEPEDREYLADINLQLHRQGEIPTNVEERQKVDDIFEEALNLRDILQGHLEKIDISLDEDLTDNIYGEDRLSEIKSLNKTLLDYVISEHTPSYRFADDDEDPILMAMQSNLSNEYIAYNIPGVSCSFYTKISENRILKVATYFGNSDKQNTRYTVFDHLVPDDEPDSHGYDYKSAFGLSIEKDLRTGEDMEPNIADTTYFYNTGGRYSHIDIDNITSFHPKEKVALPLTSEQKSRQRCAETEFLPEFFSCTPALLEQFENDSFPRPAKFLSDLKKDLEQFVSEHPEDWLSHPNVKITNSSTNSNSASYVTVTLDGKSISFGVVDENLANEVMRRYDIFLSSAEDSISDYEALSIKVLPEYELNPRHNDAAVRYEWSRGFSNMEYTTSVRIPEPKDKEKGEGSNEA